MRAFRMTQMLKVICEQDASGTLSSPMPYTLDPNLVCKNFNGHSDNSEFLVSTRTGLITIPKQVRNIDHSDLIQVRHNQVDDAEPFVIRPPTNLKLFSKETTHNIHQNYAPAPASSTDSHNRMDEKLPNVAVSPKVQIKREPTVQPQPSTSTFNFEFPKKPQPPREADDANLLRTRPGKVGYPYYPSNYKYSNANPDDPDDACSTEQLQARESFQRTSDFKTTHKAYATPPGNKQVIDELKNKIFTNSETSFEQGIVRVIFSDEGVSLDASLRSLIRRSTLGDLQSLSKDCGGQIFKNQFGMKRGLIPLRWLLRLAGLIIDYNYDYVMEDSCDQIKRLFVMDDVIREMVQRPLIPMAVSFVAVNSVQEAMENYYHIFYNYLAPVSKWSTFMTTLDILSQPPKSKQRYKFRLEAMAKYLTLLFINFAAGRPDNAFESMTRIFYTEGNIKSLVANQAKKDRTYPQVTAVDLVKKLPFDRLLQLILLNALRGITRFHPDILNKNDIQFSEYSTYGYDNETALKLIGAPKATWDVVHQFCIERLRQIYKSVATGEPILQSSHVSNIEMLALIVENGLKLEKFKPSNMHKPLDEFYNDENLFEKIINTEYLMPDGEAGDELIKVFNDWGYEFFDSNYEYSFETAGSPKSKKDGKSFHDFLVADPRPFVKREKPSE